MYAAADVDERRPGPSKTPRGGGGEDRVMGFRCPKTEKVSKEIIEDSVKNYIGIEHALEVEWTSPLK